MKRYDLTPEFVEEMPSPLEEGKLYVSIRYRTAAHLCACGCGNKVVTPIKPPKWHLTYDGETVSLFPSVGNHQFECRSHYVIKKNQVRWARPWTDEEIVEGRASDADDLQKYYESRTESRDDSTEAPRKRRGLFSRLRGRPRASP
jgi:hypothetical protein